MNRTVGMFATLMFALIMVGPAYAMLGNTIHIESYARVSRVGVKFANVSCSDTGIDPGYDKDVASCSARLIDHEQTISITVSNGYPCYSCDVNFDVVNTGQKPVKVSLVIIDEDRTKKLIQDIPEITVTVEGISQGDVINVGETKSGRLRIHIEQCARELSSYSFCVKMQFVIEIRASLG